MLASQKNVQVLDCTLRDGGRVIDCAFPDREIRGISKRLSEAKIDIIEVGFLRDSSKVRYSGDSTFFTDVDQIMPFIDKSSSSMFVAFIDFGMFDFDKLKPHDGTSIDGIRFGFTKKDIEQHREEVIESAEIIKKLGYKLFVQGVNSLNYTDAEILGLVDLVNQIHPYSFGIVDTYGAMYIDDVDRLYGLIDHNMDQDICINFHSHNNYQLSFAFAQEVIKLSKGVRRIIIDGTLCGMGKVAGNLNLELVVDYLSRKMHYDYEMDTVLDTIDDYIYPYMAKCEWGYSIPGMMAGIYKSHPNNILYLTQKFRLETKDIRNILSMIDSAGRQRYDYDNIERIYAEYSAVKVDDSSAIEELKSYVCGREVLVLVPGNSLNTYRAEIDEYVKTRNPLVISVNFVPDEPSGICFFGGQKRYNLSSGKRIGRKVVVSSNVRSDSECDLKIDYNSLINRGYRLFDNSAIMLLNLLRKLGSMEVTIAGFDGFSEELGQNFADQSFQNDRCILDFDELNAEVGRMFADCVETVYPDCRISLLTPSKYEAYIPLSLVDRKYLHGE